MRWKPRSRARVDRRSRFNRGRSPATFPCTSGSCARRDNRLHGEPVRLEPRHLRIGVGLRYGRFRASPSCGIRQHSSNANRAQSRSEPLRRALRQAVRCEGCRAAAKQAAAPRPGLVCGVTRRRFVCREHLGLARHLRSESRSGVGRRGDGPLGLLSTRQSLLESLLPSAGTETAFQCSSSALRRAPLVGHRSANRPGPTEIATRWCSVTTKDRSKAFGTALPCRRSRQGHRSPGSP